MKQLSFHQSLSSTVIQAVGMASVQYAVLLLTLAMAVQECNGTPERIRCTSELPCIDLLIVERMAQHVSKDVVSNLSDIRWTVSSLLSLGFVVVVVFKID